MDEVFKYQESITDSLKIANDKYGEVEQLHGIPHRLSATRDYQEKIINLRRSLLAIKDKSSKLKRRANRILEGKAKEDLERQKSRERREALDKHLEPVISTRRGK